MASAGDLRPRPLWPGEMPTRGDLHFAVGIGADSTIVSKLIAAGTASRTNHVAIITDVTDVPVSDDAERRRSILRWTMVEALADGVVQDTLEGAPRSTVIRLSDDPAIRDAVACEAEAWATAMPRFGYDWWTIGRIVFVALVGRMSFFTFPAAAAPFVGPTVHSFVATVGIEAFAVVSLYHLQRPMHRLALHVPWPDPADRVICSEVGRHVIESVFTADALPGLRDVPPSMTAPGDLLQELLGRCDRWSGPAGRRLARNRGQARHRPIAVGSRSRGRGGAGTVPGWLPPRVLPACASHWSPASAVRSASAEQSPMHSGPTAGGSSPPAGGPTTTG